jgi:hypothetical protein
VPSCGMLLHELKWTSVFCFKTIWRQRAFCYSYIESFLLQVSQNYGTFPQSWKALVIAP